MLLLHLLHQNTPVRPIRPGANCCRPEPSVDLARVQRYQDKALLEGKSIRLGMLTFFRPKILCCEP